MSKKCVESDQKRNEIGIRFDTLDELNQHLEYNKVSKTFCFPNKCRDCGCKSDEETNSPAAKRAKTTGFKIKEELLKMMKKDGKNAKLYEQVEERQVANKKELSDMDSASRPCWFRDIEKQVELLVLQAKNVLPSTRTWTPRTR